MDIETYSIQYNNLLLKTKYNDLTAVIVQVDSTTGAINLWRSQVAVAGSDHPGAGAGHD